MPLAGTCSWVGVVSATGAHLRRARLLGLLFVVLLDGRHDGVARGADELRAVLGGPVPARGQRFRRALEAGRHVAGDQLVGVAGGGGVGPFVAHQEERAESLGLLLQPGDLRDGVLHRPDDREARSVERVDERLEVLRIGRQRQGGDALEVVDPLLEAERDVGHRLFLGVGDVHGADQPPVVAVDRGGELLGPLLHDVPVRAQHVEAAGGGGADGEQAAPEATGGPGPGRRDLRRHGHLGEGALVRPQLQAGLDQLEPVRLHGDRLTGEQGQDGLQGLLHHVALPGRVDAHHEGVGGECAGADPDHHAAAGQVVEQHHAVGQHERMVVGQRRHARTETDVAGALRGRRDEHLGRGDDLVAGGVVLAEPGLVEAELVQMLDQLEIALERQGRVLAHRMERGQEDPELEVAVGVNGGHRTPCLSLCLRRYGFTRILPCSPGARRVSKAPGAPARSTADVTSRSAPGTPAAKRCSVAANSSGV